VIGQVKAQCATVTETTSISIIVCAHSDERRAQLLAALNSVRELQRQPAAEVIAVIDHNPALHDLVAAACADVRVVSNQARRGLAGARNTGIECARGDIVAFLDDDALAAPDWTARILRHYADPAVMGVGGRIVPVWPTARPRWLPEEFDWVVGCSYRGQPDHVAAVRNLIGCNMSFRRSLFDRIGGFTEGLGREASDASGCEETELCIRAAEAFPQRRIIYDPDILVLHQLTRERTTWRYFRRRCLAEGRSKAMVARTVGASHALSSERRYATRVLPSGIVRGIADAALKLDVYGLARAGTILAGLGYATWSYQATKWAGRRRVGAAEIPFAPIRVVDLDLASSLPHLHAYSPDSKTRYGAAFCLVRYAGRPIRVTEIPFDADDITPARLRELLCDGVEPPISPSPRRATRLEDPPAIGIVVATRDRPRSLAVCLDSLLCQDYEDFEIVVVDNAPASSETAQLIDSRYAPTGRVRYVRDDRPGLGQAHNSGLQHISAPIVAFTDDDVRVDPQWLAAIAANFERSANAGCVVGLILPAELDTRAQYWTERHGGFGKGCERRVFDLANNRPPGRLFPFAAGQFGSGANMAFRADALKRVDGFDPALGAGTIARGGDDLAAFVAVIRAGYQLIYEPEAIVWHHHRREVDGMRRQAFSYGVGLGAYLTKVMIDDPSVLLHFAQALPAALVHLLSSSSPKNQRLPADYPAELVWRERLGIGAGMSAYFRSRATLQRPPRPTQLAGRGIHAESTRWQ
jgi:GT2 family glycosyltransferase